jgi:hypothetical protein
MKVPVDAINGVILFDYFIGVSTMWIMHGGCDELTFIIRNLLQCRTIRILTVLFNCECKICS